MQHEEDEYKDAYNVDGEDNENNETEYENSNEDKLHNEDYNEKGNNDNNGNECEREKSPGPVHKATPAKSSTQPSEATTSPK